MSGLKLSAQFMILGCAISVFPGCTPIPELDATLSQDAKDADFPALVPIETILRPGPPPQEDSENLREDLEARRESLQRRASALNAPIVDAETQDRMNAGVNN